MVCNYLTVIALILLHDSDSFTVYKELDTEEEIEILIPFRHHNHFQPPPEPQPKDKDNCITTKTIAEVPSEILTVIEETEENTNDEWVTVTYKGIYILRMYCYL